MGGVRKVSKDGIPHDRGAKPKRIGNKAGARAEWFKAHGGRQIIIANDNISKPAVNRVTLKGGLKTPIFNCGREIVASRSVMEDRVTVPGVFKPAVRPFGAAPDKDYVLYPVQQNKGSDHKPDYKVWEDVGRISKRWIGTFLSFPRVGTTLGFREGMVKALGSAYRSAFDQALWYGNVLNTFNPIATLSALDQMSWYGSDFAAMHRQHSRWYRASTVSALDQMSWYGSVFAAMRRQHLRWAAAKLPSFDKDHVPVDVLRRSLWGHFLLEPTAQRSVADQLSWYGSMVKYLFYRITR